MFLIYNLVLVLLAPFWLLYTLYRSKKRKESPIWDQRWGNLPVRPSLDKPRIWIHAVSVGEVVAAIPILQAIRKQAPGVDVLLSTTTSTGYATAQKLAGDLVGNIVYFPFELLRSQLAAYIRVRPQVVATMETELWMNFFWEGQQFGAKTFVINGRLSDRSMKRSGRLGWYYRTLFSYVDQVLAQSEEDADRFKTLGAKEVVVPGNSKFDQALHDTTADAEAWRSALGIHSDDFVIVVGSTRGEEEERLVLAALSKLDIPNLKVIHAPRHLESASVIASQVPSQLQPVGQRSKGEAGKYIILDTFGELSKVYCLADIAIIGGGFRNSGGQNLLQPLAQGKPVLMGPNMHNFRSAAAEAKEVGAAIEVSSAEELASSITKLYEHPEQRMAMGKAASQMVAKHAGASDKIAKGLIAAAKEVFRAQQSRMNKSRT